jgi:hypothetical protein
MYCQSFCRSLLTVTMDTVKAIVEPEDIKAAWTWKSDRAGANNKHVEFHGPDGFYWSGRGCCLWSARTAGWNAYLQRLMNQAEEEGNTLWWQPVYYPEQTVDNSARIGQAYREKHINNLEG